MTASVAIKQGDFTGLAENYAKYRPAYSETVLTAIMSLVDKPVQQIDFADVGAGTGIWTQMVACRGCQSVTAVEPNDDMRRQGKQQLDVAWVNGSGERTTLESQSVDLLSMASSFHWVDFAAGTKEFHRVLRPGGRFVALWNPRFLNDNPVLMDIEEEVYRLAPHIKRKSSGKSSFVEELTAQLNDSPYFDDVIYLEGRHTVQLTHEQYIGVWNSVNDIRAQMGEAVWQQFMRYVSNKITALDSVDCSYLTRAWAARRK